MDDFFPRVITTLFGVGIKDTVISTWAMMVIVLIVAALLWRKRPAALDLLLDFLTDAVSMVMGRPAEPFMALLGSLAVFVGISNSIGVVPGLQSPTRDINTPTALALVVFMSVHYYGVRSRGLLGYLRGLADPLMMLPLELIGQVSRTLALALRLFGNVLSTEMIVAVIFSLLPLIVPLPLMAMSLLTGLLQAYIFTVLAAVYVGAAVTAAEPTPKRRSK
jgi:F-type H+-transporting ATPase subunit a